MKNRSILLLAGMAVASGAFAGTTIVDFDNQLKGSAAPVLGSRYWLGTIDTASSATSRNVGKWNDPTLLTTATAGNIIRVADTAVPARANQSQALEMKWSFTDGTPVGAQQSTNPLDTFLRTFASFASSALPCPAFDLTQKLKFDIYSDVGLRVCLIVRESDLTGKTVGDPGPITGTVATLGGPASTADALQASGVGRGGYVVPAKQWTTITFDLSNTANYTIRRLTGSGALASLSGNNLVALEGFGFTPLDGQGLVPTKHVVYVDNIRNGDDPAGIHGKINLGDFVGDPSTVTADLELRDANDAVVDSTTVALDANGNFTWNTTAVDGTYKIHAKANHWLGHTLNGLLLSGGGASGINFSLLNGDVDGDDSVTIFDYVDLSNAFDSTDVDGNWNPLADLDGDGAVTIFDYLVLSNNFDMFGD
ncbi:MAG: hypothetical protein JST40_03545 [Armatimonadetes bacterium]|nr:hypothetical protein [Armatimonadota bacterium]